MRARYASSPLPVSQCPCQCPLPVEFQRLTGAITCCGYTTRTQKEHRASRWCSHHEYFSREMPADDGETPTQPRDYVLRVVRVFVSSIASTLRDTDEATARRLMLPCIAWIMWYKQLPVHTRNNSLPASAPESLRAPHVTHTSLTRSAFLRPHCKVRLLGGRGSPASAPATGCLPRRQPNASACSPCFSARPLRSRSW